MTTPRVPTFKIWITEGYKPLADEARQLFAKHNMLLEVEGGAGDFDFNSTLQIVATLVIFGPATAFLSAFAAEGGKDAYKHLREFLKEQRRPKQKFQLVMLRDPEAEVGILMSDELPDEALQQLFDLDLKSVAGPFNVAAVWNSDERRWKTDQYPKPRTDLFGWYASPPTAAWPQKIWHMTADPNSSPLRTLCKQELAHPEFSEKMYGQNCQRCMMVDTISTTDHVPPTWDLERADWKRDR